MNPINPFMVSGYRGPEYFCDRERALSWLIDQFDKDRNAVIYSWRYMGKTAFVKHFFHFLEMNEKAETVYVDLLGTGNLEDAGKRIAIALLDRYGDREQGITSRLRERIVSAGVSVAYDREKGVWQVSFPFTGSLAVLDFLDATGRFLSETGKPVVVCLDEFQLVGNYSEPDAEATFSTWMRNFPSIRVICCGSHLHRMLSMFGDISRPLYRSARLLQLDPLPAEPYRDFIRTCFEKGNKRIGIQQIDRLFRWTRMQTYYIQLVCNKLYSGSDSADGRVMDDIFKELIRERTPLFSYFRPLFTAYQWKLLIAISKEEMVEKPLAQRFTGKYGLGAASSVRTALQALNRKEFVIYYERKYTLHDTLLMRWLQET